MNFTHLILGWDILSKTFAYFSSSYNGLKNQSHLCLRMGFFFYCMCMAFVVEYSCRKIHGFFFKNKRKKMKTRVDCQI
jgi:hypothetical protein